MIKIISALILSICTLSAQYEIIDKPNVFTVKIENETFDELYANLKSEINFQSFIIVHELNLAKSTANVAEALEKTAVVKNGINILICKSSFTLQMHEENIENITYCPMIISVYEDKNFCYISYKKYHSFKKGDTIASLINEKLKNLILQSLD